MSGDQHISRITTIWTEVFQAHGSDTDAARQAQDAVLARYSQPIYRYLLKLLGDVHAADEVFQEFALAFVRGGFRHADPQRGRFRDYLKVTLVRLVSKHRQRRPLAGAQPYDSNLQQPDHEDDFDRAFNDSCREEYLSRTWQRLQEHESQSGQPYYTLLHWRAENPQGDSGQAAEYLQQRLNRPQTPEATRKTLQRSRRRFAELLIKEVQQAIGDDSHTSVEAELAELDLLHWCAPVLKSKS